MFDLFTLGLIGGGFLLAGFVKGVVGLGLPTVSLAVLAVAIDLPTAMALLVVPSLCTNIWQAVGGGHFGVLVRRLWPLLLAVAVMVWVGVQLSSQIDIAILTRILGVLLVIYALSALTGTNVQIPLRMEPAIAALCGAVNGVLTGLTGTLFMPGIIYLQALGLTRDQLVQAMGLLFAVSTASLGVNLQHVGRIDAGLWAVSAAALLPALIGMQCGRYCRGYLSEPLFRKIFLITLAGLGLYITM
jgi:uncharacterized membrane protein YfcA